MWRGNRKEKIVRRERKEYSYERDGEKSWR